VFTQPGAIAARAIGCAEQHEAHRSRSVRFVNSLHPTSAFDWTFAIVVWRVMAQLGLIDIAGKSPSAFLQAAKTVKLTN
ncbi:hypothetical protein, partial [Methylomonas methanica]|uniref:hypothetical protein n=1 Tax=Methylomonas methanica TaxID=421 RepID=UPI00257024DC